MRKSISIFEIIIMLCSVLAFSYLVADSTTQNVSASEYVPSGCCLKTKSGATCQDMPLSDSSSCSDSLVGTGCNVIESCQSGCCYSLDLGVCTMNSPKEKCEFGGGNWAKDALCNIEECQMGCCMIGNGASLSTNRECTLLSRSFNMDKKFLPIDSTGSCSAYIGLSQEGACVGASTDFSKERSCTYTTKGNCNQEFKQGYLCTSKELNTSCLKTKDTTCVDGKDQIYFTDSCGNKANIYDSSKYNDDSYWEKYISPDQSCQTQGSGCGNCDYKTGSICTKYVSGKDLIKPVMGDNICKNLNCANGRKHGESWCVYDFNPNAGVAPVGSRNYIASCLEGEISISGCADFNQEVCAQSTDVSNSFTEAKCLVNDWRSCLNANDADSYSEVEKKCAENPQCVMFNDFYSGSLNRSDGEAFAGFDAERMNDEQGSIDTIGEDQNTVLTHCVPRFTPGFQFWTSGSAISDSEASPSSATESFASYGGSAKETSAICSLGNFVCVSQTSRDCTLAGGCGSWKDNDLNWECNSDGAHTTIKGSDLPNLLSALNDRCRSIGSCGVSTNYLGSTNENNPGFSVSRIKINAKGKTEKDIDTSYYNLSGSYISSIKRATPIAKKLTDITSTNGGLSADATDSAGTAGDVSGSVIDVTTLIDDIGVGSSTTKLAEFMNILGPLTIAGATMLGSWFASAVSTTTVPVSVWPTWNAPAGATVQSTTWETATYTQPNSNLLTGFKAAGITIAFTIIGSYVGQQLGGLIAKNQGWSPGKTGQFIAFMGSIGGTLGYVAGTATVGATLGAGGATGAAGAGTALGTMSGFGAGGVFGGGGVSVGTVMGPLGLAVAIAYIIYEAFFNDYEEQEYYILQFNCQSWQPPKQGDCSVCNEDVRPCSEYKCKSIGNNCHYFIENGEPGYCASLSEIWSAKISPWNEILTEGNKYSAIKDSGFKIEGKTKEEVAAWKPLQFGIITNKQAVCKLDANHSAEFGAMQYAMFSSTDYSTGKVDGTHHSIILSPHAIDGDSEGTTPELKEGDNEYYIKCKNFAGQVNDAAFIVQVKQDDGPDLTEAQILRFNPIDGSYLAKDSNSTQIAMYLNEPAECKYSLEYDETYYKDMNNSFNCITDPTSAYYGEWLCYAALDNITANKIEMFVKCKDQPDLVETDLIKRNMNSQSKRYSLNVCGQGLEASVVSPSEGIIEINSSASLQLEVKTSGCINGGDAVCSFSVENYGNLSTIFFETGGKKHDQPLTTLGLGEKKININCEDSAGNKANTSTNFTIYLDDSAPKISRIIRTASELSLQTDENAECLVTTNNTIGCAFNFSTAKGIYKTQHVLDITDQRGETFYVKCTDKKGNNPIGCTEVLSIL